MTDSAPPLTFGVAASVSPLPHASRMDEEPLTRSERRRAWTVVAIAEALPESGSVLIVHSPTVVATWRQHIHEARGPAVAAVTRVLSAPTMRDELALTAGLDVPVIRDPFVDEAREHRRALAQAWRL